MKSKLKETEFFKRFTQRIEQRNIDFRSWIYDVTEYVETNPSSRANNLSRSERPLAKPQTNHRRPRITNRLVRLDSSVWNVSCRVVSRVESFWQLDTSTRILVGRCYALLPSCSGTRDTSI